MPERFDKTGDRTGERLQGSHSVERHGGSCRPVHRSSPCFSPSSCTPWNAVAGVPAPVPRAFQERSRSVPRNGCWNVSQAEFQLSHCKC
jgi:hypothetical protein